MSMTLCSCRTLTELLVEDPLNYEISKKPNSPTTPNRREAKEKASERQKLIEQGKCPDCYGIGKTADGKYNCATCNGTGKLTTQ